jgi:hypothetical protein
MLVIFSIHDRIKLLPYFLEYYSSIGATQFECVIYNGVNNPHYQQILDYESKYNLRIRSFLVNVDAYNVPFFAPALDSLRKLYSVEFGWYSIADLDEFHFFGGRTLLEVIKEANSRGSEAVHGMYCDRIAEGGIFPEIDGPLDRTFPLACDITRFCGACSDKVVLARSHIRIIGGHHRAKTKAIWRDVAEVHHFKWVKGVDRIMEERYKNGKEKQRPFADELQKLIGILKNGIDVTDSRLNVRKASAIGI